MKRYQVKVTAKALSRLTRLYDYIHGITQVEDIAQAQRERLEEAILSLASMPERCRVMESEPWKSRGMRRLLVDNYSVFYFIAENEIRVTDIIYSKADLLRRLAKIE